MYHTKLLDIKSTKQPKTRKKNSMIKVNTTIITTASSTAFITATTQPKEHRSPYIFFYGLACITINYYDMISPTRKHKKITSCSQQDGLYSFFLVKSQVSNWSQSSRVEFFSLGRFIIIVFIIIMIVTLHSHVWWS